MPELAFVISPRQNWYLREFVETLRYELEHQDAPSTLHTDGFPDPRPDLVYVLVEPHDYLSLEGNGALPDEQTLKRTIFLCAHRPGVIDPDEDANLLGRAAAVFDLEANSVACHRKAGIAARHLRPGYSKLRDRFDPEAERTIDVMFLGAHSRRRTRQLGRCARTLAPHNCLLQISDDSRPNLRGSTSFIAEGKWELLTRSKILLNVHRGQEPYLEWLRVLDAIHSGVVVVTEHSSGISPLAAGEHLLVASPESLPFVLEAALRDEKRLRRIRASAHEHIRSWLPFAQPVSVFRAAAVELVGRSISTNVWLGRRLAAPPPVSSTPRDSYVEGNGMRRALRDVSLEVVRLRREVSRLEQIVRSGPESPTQPQVVYESPSWSSPTTAGVTVLTAACDCAETTQLTLDSLGDSWFRDFELVVVDDASTDDSSAVVLEWMRLNPTVPALLVRHPVGRGLGAARNTAADYARGRYSLTLDAGDAVYPRCLEALVGTLDGLPEPAFAYPMLEVFGMTESFLAAGGDCLLNVFGWEPSRLLQWAPVNGLAMIRTDRLRELGGFGSKLELSGWEDYDFWCRVADRGWRGQLVPQVLGRYRASSARITRLSEAPPLTELIDRSPRLLRSVTDALSANLRRDLVGA